MLSIARRSCGRASNPLIRGLAQVVPSTPATEVSSPAPTTSSGDAWKHGKVPVNDSHGLYGFFRRKADAKLSGEDAYETVQSARLVPGGRAWRATELRLKSFQDLHTLWYVTLRERNLLETQQEEARRMGIKIALQAQTDMAQACRKTMARIKAVMNERRLAYEGALQLLENEQEQVEDKKLLRMQREALAQSQKKLVLFKLQNRLLQREKRRAISRGKTALDEEVALNVKTATEVTDAPTSNSSPVEAKSPSKAEESVSLPSKASTPKAPKVVVPEGPSRPATPAETASAGLFGDAPRK